MRFPIRFRVQIQETEVEVPLLRDARELHRPKIAEARTGYYAPRRSARASTGKSPAFSGHERRGAWARGAGRAMCRACTG